MTYEDYNNDKINHIRTIYDYFNDEFDDIIISSDDIEQVDVFEKLFSKYGIHAFVIDNDKFNINVPFTYDEFLTNYLNNPYRTVDVIFDRMNILAYVLTIKKFKGEENG